MFAFWIKTNETGDLNQGLASSGGEEANSPDENVDDASDQTGLADENDVLLAVFGHHSPADHEGEALDECECPLAVLDERLHKRIDLHNLALGVKDGSR